MSSQGRRPAIGSRGLLAAVTVALLCSPLLGGCSRVATSSGDQASASSGSCSDLLTDARSLVRSGQTGDGRLDSIIDTISHRCDDEYDTFIDEVSGAAAWRAEQETQQSQEQPGGGLPWDDAAEYIGTVQRVCGPLATIRNSSDDVFLNVGRDYPDASRFTIVLWDIGGVESIASGTTVCTEGLITSYEGVAQIELRSASDVEIWE